MADKQTAAGPPVSVLDRARAALVLNKVMEKPAAEGADAFEILRSYLGLAKDRAALQAALQFVAPAARELPEEERDDLREQAVTLLQSMRNRVQTVELHGEHIKVTTARFLETKFGGTYLLTCEWMQGPRQGQEFETWLPGSENGPTFRFFARRRKDQYPVEVIFTRDPHEFTNDKGQKQQGFIWRVERVPESAAPYSAVPF